MYKYECDDKNIFLHAFFMLHFLWLDVHSMGVPNFGKALGCILICLSFYLVTEFFGGRKVHGGHTKCAFN